MAKARKAPRVRLLDTTFRDAQQSLVGGHQSALFLISKRNVETIIDADAMPR